MSSLTTSLGEMQENARRNENKGCLLQLILKCFRRYAHTHQKKYIQSSCLPNIQLSSINDSTREMEPSRTCLTMPAENLHGHLMYAFCQKGFLLFQLHNHDFHAKPAESGKERKKKIECVCVCVRRQSV